MSNRLPTLGDKVRHIVTGFEGIIVSHSKYPAGCDRMWVEPHVDEKGNAREGQWIDIDLLEITKASVVPVVEYSKAAPGGIDLPRYH